MKIIKSIIVLFFLQACSSAPVKIIQPSFENLNLPLYSKQQLETDFDLMAGALREAHTGLYWYTSREKFDSILTRQRSMINDSLNGLDFYNIAAPVVAATMEDHCDISLSEKIEQAFAANASFLPLSVIHLNNKIYLLNNPVSGKAIKGFELLSVNDMPVNEIEQRLFNTFASDGFILSSKYRYLDFLGFAEEYAKVLGQAVRNTIRLLNPETGKQESYTVTAVSEKELRAINKNVVKENKIRKEIEKPAELTLSGNHTAILSFRTFSNSKFSKFNMNFKNFVDSSFKIIAKNLVQNLVIDIRDNGGGSEGNEDYLFSWLNDKPYNKYKYVEASALTFSFLQFTDYATPVDQKELEDELKEENEQAADGKYYRRPGLYIPQAPNVNAFKGRIFVLTSGWTYSGGAEFSTLLKEHTNAIFIGEETGGGYFGNTSGTSLELTLPNSKLLIDIPVLKFVLDVKNGKFGRGVIPDYPVQPTISEFLEGQDVEMMFAEKLIAK